MLFWRRTTRFSQPTPGIGSPRTAGRTDPVTPARPSRPPELCRSPKPGLLQSRCRTPATHRQRHDRGPGAGPQQRLGRDSGRLTPNGSPPRGYCSARKEAARPTLLCGRLCRSGRCRGLATSRCELATGAPPRCRGWLRRPCGLDRCRVGPFDCAGLQINHPGSAPAACVKWLVNPSIPAPDEQVRGCRSAVGFSSSASGRESVKTTVYQAHAVAGITFTSWRV